LNAKGSKPEYGSQFLSFISNVSIATSPSLSGDLETRVIVRSFCVVKCSAISLRSFNSSDNFLFVSDCGITVGIVGITTGVVGTVGITTGCVGTVGVIGIVGTVGVVGVVGIVVPVLIITHVFTVGIIGSMIVVFVLLL